MARNRVLAFAMFNLMLRVRHGHCGICEEPAKLYLLAGDGPSGLDITPLPVGVHAGACISCWKVLAKRILERANEL